MTVIFSTYQSIDVVSEAQKNYGLPDITLTICDEAHRTAGGFLIDQTNVANNEETAFTRIHSDDFIKSKKRLYMTATPKIYGTEAKKSRDAGEAILYSMDDETVFGPIFHEISFRRAVELGSLVDYKVVVLTVDEKSVTDNVLGYDVVENGGMSVTDAAKVIGCWRALTKKDIKDDIVDGDTDPMRRAVGFAQVINPTKRYDRVSSKVFAAQFQRTIETYKERVKKDCEDKGLSFDESEFSLVCDTEHIDGSMDAFEKSSLLGWLREDVEQDHCKILFNVRCLSEGVDVPALDAVMFLSPRKSQVDVVQTVGRVMRTSPNTKKKRGYIIIPIVTPSNVDADLVLNNNKDFNTVWQILKALKSIDPTFGVAVDGQLGKIDKDRIEVICLTETVKTKTKKESSGLGDKGSSKGKGDKGAPDPTQGTLDFGRNEIMEEQLKSRIVQKVGNVREWSDWAKEVGKVCTLQIEHIHKVLDDETHKTARAKFAQFLTDLRAMLNDGMDRDAAIEMLGQHIVTAPIMDALFNEYPFIEQNPIGQALTAMVSALDKKEMDKSRSMLEDFYKAVRYRARNVISTAERQIVVRELFDKFFKYAFPKQQEKLGIVYTPEEVVDFINQSVADLLKKEFGQSLEGEGVHILDPFTGTGTFITRLMASDLIAKDKLKQKFENELHANEIVPLAYYIASMNVESMYHDITGDPEYKPNNVMALTDTFNDARQADLELKSELSANSERIKAVHNSDIRIIIGNPPYSVGQESQNDDNQNEHYEQLDARLAETYVAKTKSSLKGKLYDSYIRAFRWASDRIGNKGIIGFVTNAGWIESNSADGMRKCMAQEFNSIYIYHLKGNARTSGLQRQKEKDNIFGEGSRAPVAITLLVKNPEAQEKGKIYFHAVGDYLTREEKLKELETTKSMLATDLTPIVPDRHGDWLHQRDDSYNKFISIGQQKSIEQTLFKRPIVGVSTNRDSWVYGSSSKQVIYNIKRTQAAYRAALDVFEDTQNLDDARASAMGNISWTSGLLKLLANQEKLDVANLSKIRVAAYRPFFPQKLYYESKGLVERPGKWSTVFPSNKEENLVICVNQNAKDAGQIALMSNHIGDLHFNGDTQCFPRYIYGEEVAQPIDLLIDLTISTRSKESAITKEALKHFSAAYEGESVSADDLFYYIYGILHSEDYRKRYANNLMKELPRIPRVSTHADFKLFAEAGRKLADLHVNFEKQKEYEGVTIEEKPGCSYHVSQMRYGKIPGQKGNAAKDKTLIIYNEDVTIRGIPLEAQEYVVNKKSALDWVVERACVSVDKNSGIVNDFNDYGMEMVPPQPRYPLSLVLKVITVSIETMKIVKSLPKLEIHPLDL